MRDIRHEIGVLLQDMAIFQKNCNAELERCPKGRLYCSNNGTRIMYMCATDIDEACSGPARKVIDFEGDDIRRLARKKLLEMQEKYLADDIIQIEKILRRIHSYTIEEIITEMPRAYRNLPIEYFLERIGSVDAKRRTDAEMKTNGNWTTETTGTGIIVPKRLIRAAKSGTLTESQRREIREIQREWACQPYEYNTKNLEKRNIVTSTGRRVRSKSEAMLIERMDYYDIPFRYDQIIRIGSRVVSPDLTFFSILDGEHYWEHGGMISSQEYADYHKYKRRLYESAGIESWKNYIETFDEGDGSINIQMIDAEIKYKLMKRLQLA